LQAILACGAEVVFTDILDDTLCLDPSGLEEVISPRTKAIIATDYARHVCIHDEISRVAQEQGLRVVHDAAHSIGSTYLGQPIGSFSDITIFSFDPVKTFTCIDGGAVVVDDPESLRTLREARLIGMGQPTEVMYQDRRAWTYDVHRVGYRYHMANLHAAIGLAQLRKRPLIQENRRRYCSIYDDAFSSCQLLRPQREPLDGILPFLYYVRVKNQLRDEFRNGLSRKGIDTGVHWQPGHRFSLFSSARRGRLDVTEVAAAEIVSLPLHSVMSDETINRVIDAVISTAEELV
jgi:dTDP-4-amino-4,6-dideoxygalactose transaminase